MQCSVGERGSWSRARKRSRDGSPQEMETRERRKREAEKWQMLWGRTAATNTALQRTLKTSHDGEKDSIEDCVNQPIQLQCKNYEVKDRSRLCLGEKKKKTQANICVGSISSWLNAPWAHKQTLDHKRNSRTRADAAQVETRDSKDQETLSGAVITLSNDKRNTFPFSPGDKPPLNRAEYSWSIKTIIIWQLNIIVAFFPKQILWLIAPWHQFPASLCQQPVGSLHHCFIL